MLRHFRMTRRPGECLHLTSCSHCYSCMCGTAPRMRCKTHPLLEIIDELRQLLLVSGSASWRSSFVASDASLSSNSCFARVIAVLQYSRTVQGEGCPGTIISRPRLVPLPANKSYPSSQKCAGDCSLQIASVAQLHLHPPP